MARFCPRCGKRGIEKEFCEACLEEIRGKEPIVMLGEIKTKVCVLCNKFLLQNKWVRCRDPKEMIRRLSENALAKYNIKGGIKKAKLEFSFPDMILKEGMQPEIDVNASTKEKKFSIPIILEYTSCGQCSKFKSDYYEGILQVRNVNDEIIRFIEKYAENGKNRGFFITNCAGVRNGMDFYMTHQNKILALARKLQMIFGGILKISAKIQTRDAQKGREVFRTTVYFCALPFKKGDYIVFDDRLYYVTNVGKKINAIDIENGKRNLFDYKEGMQITVLEKKKTKVTKIRPRIEILDPWTYQSVHVENEKKVTPGENIQVVEKNGKFWIV